VKAWLVTFLVGTRTGYELNEGYDVSVPEGLRAVPYLAYVPALAHSFAASAGRTRYEAVYENGLAPAAYGDFTLEAIAATRDEAIVSVEEAQLYGRLLATGSHLTFAAVRRAKDLRLISDDDYKASLARLVKPNGRLTEVIVEVNPQNQGLLTAAYDAGVLTADDIRRLIAARLRRPNYLCAETLLLASKADAIDATVRKAGLEFVLSRSALRLLDEARRAGAAPSDAAARAARLTRRQGELRAQLAAAAARLPAPKP
jgi:hypothetical protein